MHTLKINKLAGWKSITLVISALLTVSCTTNKRYFPATATERAADRIIERIIGEDGQASVPSERIRSDDQYLSWSPDKQAVQIVIAILDMISAETHAASPAGIFGPPTLHRATQNRSRVPELDISSPAVTEILSSMQQRHSRLLKHYKSGAIGYDSDGFVAVRDLGVIDVKQHRELEQLIAEENRDRDALYREIAVANGYPEWQAQIRDTFSRRWVAKAPPGWYYQNRSGIWEKK